MSYACGWLAVDIVMTLVSFGVAAKTFKEVAGVSGIIMTKLDGTARGGVLVAAAEQYGLPIHAIGVGEKIDDLRPFDPDLVARVIAGVA